MFTEIRVLKAVSLYDIVKEVIVCPQNCGKSYKTHTSLKKHLKYECNKMPQFKCLFCDQMSKRPDNLRTHMKVVHRYNSFTPNNVLCHTFNEIYEEKI